MQTPKTYWQKHSLEIILVLVVFVLAAVVSDQFYGRIDLTSNKQYTLSKSSREVLRNVDGIVTAKFFLSRDIPSHIMPLADAIRDVLAEYEARGAGHFRYQVIDPTNNPDAEKRASDLGIPQTQVQVLAKDEQMVKNIYLGLALGYKDKSDAIPVVQDASNLEYELTTRILKLTRERAPVLGVVDLSRSYDINNPENKSRFTQLKSQLGDRFEVKEVKLEEQLEIPADVDALILIQPLGLSKEAEYVLDQYLLRGGTILAPCESIMLSQQMQAFPAIPGYEAVYKGYGLELKKMMVMDESNARATFRTGYGYVSLPYPMWVQVRPEGFNSDFAPISQLSSLVLPWTGYLALDKDLAEGLTATKLVTTTNRAWAGTSPYNLDPNQDWQALRADSKKGGFVLGYLLSGTFPSAYPDGPPEPGENADEERIAFAHSKLDPSKHLAKSSAPGHLIVISNSRFMEDGYLEQFPENMLFIENLADWMMDNEALIGIRSKMASVKPLEEPEEPAKSLIKYGVTVGIPLLVVLFGLARWALRRKRRGLLKLRYSGAKEAAHEQE
jgi:gliding-associated putative ABC transporter substrate-binding component GldG